MTSVPFVTALLVVVVLITLAIPPLYLICVDNKPTIKSTIVTFVAWLVPVFCWVWLELQLYSLQPSWLHLNSGDINLLYASVILGSVATALAYFAFIDPYFPEAWDFEDEEGEESESED